MSGLVKRRYSKDLILFQKRFSKPLLFVAKTLPLNYNKHILLECFKKYYPQIWIELEQRSDIYRKKDLHLSSCGKRRRYNHDVPENFFFNIPQVKKLLSTSYLARHKSSFCLENQEHSIRLLDKKRLGKIYKFEKKIEEAKLLSQEVEPMFIDYFINEYHKKNISLQEKLEIVHELKRYICEKSITFLQKLNDSERNYQIRMIAFNHLQGIGEYVKLRKKFKGKKKSYMTDTDRYVLNPKDLFEKINANEIQSKKKYDVFISHSFLDKDLVFQIIKNLNAKKYTVYCDWTSDNDFLKRNEASKFTELVLKKG